MEPGFRGVVCALESHLGEAVAASKNSWDLGLFDTFHLAVVFRYGCESKALTKHWKVDIKGVCSSHHGSGPACPGAMHRVVYP